MNLPACKSDTGEMSHGSSAPSTQLNFSTFEVAGRHSTTSTKNTHLVEV